MAKIDDLLTEYARAITNDRIDGITMMQAQADRIKAARKAIVEYMVAAQPCPVCGEPVRQAVWCSVACMEKQIGPMTATPASKT